MPGALNKRTCKECQKLTDYAKLYRRYGIDPGFYDYLLDQQNGRCAICGALPGRRRLSVDHDHVTGKVRALLCGNCNRGLGYFQDSPEILAKAIEYLRVPWRLHGGNT